MNQLKEMLEAYRNGERGLPTYDELAALAYPSTKRYVNALMPQRDKYGDTHMVRDIFKERELKLAGAKKVGQHTWEVES